MNEWMNKVKLKLKSNWKINEKIMKTKTKLKLKDISKTKTIGKI